MKKNPFEGKKVIFVPNDADKKNADGIRGHLEAVGECEQNPNIYDRYIKRFFDVILSFLGLIILSPIYIVIAVAIYIDDPGPVFFTQKRVGKNKQFFKLHKFRSMKMSTPRDVPTHMLDNPEQYITRIGKFIRAHSLDELPQIWDIFVGKMSIIGPRPGLWNQDVLIAERDKYNANSIKPGLTGWAQINGRDELEISLKAKLDGEYVNKESFSFDAKCFFGTIKKIIKDDSVVEGKVETNDFITESDIPSIAEIKSHLNIKEKKNILIAGKDSYIGREFQRYVGQFDNYVVDEFDTTSADWRNIDFSNYDVIIDVAGIAHIKETRENRDLYYTVNTELAVEMGKKAKKEGVKQFIYLSSMSVYGTSIGTITEDTRVSPVDSYGKSKWLAETELWKLRDQDFVVSIVRPPMVFGKGCKGNYQKLRSLVKKISIFPSIHNERSMLYIDNLSSTLRMIMHNRSSGVFFPQNVSYISTYYIVRTIGELNNKKIIGIGFLNVPIKFFIKKNRLIQKVFGSLVYSQSMNVPKTWIAIHENRECIAMTEAEH